MRRARRPRRIPPPWEQLELQVRRWHDGTECVLSRRGARVARARVSACGTILESQGAPWARRLAEEAAREHAASD